MAKEVRYLCHSNTEPLKKPAKLKVLNELSPQRPDCQSMPTCLEVWKCAFSPDDQWFAYSYGDSVVILVKWFQLCRTNKCEVHPKEYKIVECDHVVRSVTFSQIANLHDSTAFWHRSAKFKDFFLISGHYSGRIRVWDIVSGNLLLELLDHKELVSDIQSSLNGILASTSFDGSLKFWDLMDCGNLLKSIVTDGKALFGCRWAKDYKSLVTVGMSKIANVFSMDSISIRLKLEAHNHNVVDADFSPDSRLIATVSWDTTLIIWNAINGHILRQFNQLRPPPSPIYAGGENGHFIRSVSFSGDGAHIATVADDGFVRIWDLSDETSAEAIVNISQGLCCTYSKSGQVLAVGTRMGNIVILESHYCVKSLLFLCRSAIARRLQSRSLEANTGIIPQSLDHYLTYNELI